ncbi:cell envelope biogenesis protein OmpA [Hymenobacter aquaticus]|uniref:Cell envelope biogenesis protein OmpA n=1 Tax=Hymenobacter aquaticus TaxID=1867101 RepID=A0A4Z0Q498_9BACT|nr:OmpA family protein [Hymenobacter aquaticus]TGE24545.1 cell envelope biogenesis protein OmpA [Hymenobacter aquaticus]
MIRHFLRPALALALSTSLLTLGTSCVSQKKFTALQSQYDELSKSREQLQAQKTALEQEKARSEDALRTNLLNKNQQVNQLNDNLSGAQQANSRLSADLRSKEERIAEMQRILDQKDAAVKALRQKVGDALLGFNANDLTVNVKNGKVYVSLSEQLLFKSGSTKVDPKGQEALKKLATALQGNQDVNVLVEGHTDNVPLKGVVSGAKDNWDLSVLRATEITRLLTEAGLNPAQVTPSGRSQYVPVAANTTPAEKALNRRTEIILTPKLDELFQILEAN